MFYVTPKRPHLKRKSHTVSHLPSKYHTMLIAALSMLLPFELMLLVEAYWLEWFLLWSYGITELGLKWQPITRTQLRNETFDADKHGTFAADLILTLLTASHPNVLTGDAIWNYFSIAFDAFANEGRHDLQSEKPQHTTGIWFDLLLVFNGVNYGLESYLSEMVDRGYIYVVKTITDNLPGILATGGDVYFLDNVLKPNKQKCCCNRLFTRE